MNVSLSGVFYMYTMADTSLRGHASILAASVMWGIMAPVAKVAMTVISPFMLTTLRLVGGALLFWLVSLCVGHSEHVALHDFPRLFLASLFAFVFNQGLFLTGLSLTTPIDASVITTLLPVFTMVLAAILLHEPISGPKVLGIVLGAAGALILILSNVDAFHSVNNGSWLGDVLCMLAQFSFACYLAGFQNLTRKYSSLTINKWIFTCASLCCIPITLSDFYALNLQSLPIEAVLEVTYVVFFGSFLAYLCYVAGQRMLRPTVVSMYNYTQPIVASVLAIVMGMGVLTLTKVLAVVLVFVGVYAVTLSKSRQDLQREQRITGREER